MKKLLTITSIILISLSVKAQTEAKTNDATLTQILEVSCGQCNFGLKSKEGCDLAIKINGKAYWVDGIALESQGDAHAKDGFCSVIRTAEVAGEIIDDRFKVSYFKLLPLKIEKDEHEGHNHN